MDVRTGAMSDQLLGSGHLQRLAANFGTAPTTVTTEIASVRPVKMYCLPQYMIGNNILPAPTDTCDAGGEAAGLAAYRAGAAAPGQRAVPRVHGRRRVRAKHNTLEQPDLTRVFDHALSQATCDRVCHGGRGTNAPAAGVLECDFGSWPPSFWPLP